MDRLLTGCKDTAWFTKSRVGLLSLWRNHAQVQRDGYMTSLACAVYEAVDESDGHPSMPCSLHDEHDAVESLLAKSCFDDEPVLYFRLLLFLLDEFTARLFECYKLLGLSQPPKQPAVLSIWTNRYAKHRTCILVQHHPNYLFLDHPKAIELTSAMKHEPRVMLIDQQWLEGHADPDICEANNNIQAILLIPRLNEFVHAALMYYSAFVGYAMAHLEQVKKFQSPHHTSSVE